MDRISTAQAATMPVEFKLNGKTVIGRSDETLIETAKHYGIDIPHLCYKEGMRPDGNCRACVVEIKGERVLAPSCCRTPKDGMEVTTDNPRSVASQKMVLELLHARFRARSLGEGAESRQAALRVAAPAEARPLALGDRGEPGCLHPVHQVPARLPRGAGERRHRLRVPRRALEERVRPRRSHGRFHLCRLRRMRAGLPDGCA